MKYIKKILIILIILISFFLGFKNNQRIYLKELEEHFYYSLLDSYVTLSEYNDGVDKNGNIRAISMLNRCYYISTKIGELTNGELLNQLSDQLIINENNISKDQYKKIENLLKNLGNRHDELNSWLGIRNIIIEIDYSLQK